MKGIRILKDKNEEYENKRAMRSAKLDARLEMY